MRLGLETKIWIGVIGLGLIWAGPRARAEEPAYEPQEEFEKSKEGFGQDQPEVMIQLEEQKEKEEKPTEPKREAKPKKEEEPGKEEPATGFWKGKTVGGWGGPAVGYLPLDMNVFDPLTEDRGLNDFHNEFWPVGAVGFGRLGPLRVGGMGFGISQSQKARVAGDSRRANISLGFGGLVLEAEGDVHPRFGLFGGAMLGGGAISLSAKGNDITDDAWEESEAFFAAYPYAGFSVKPLSFMRFEASYGWLFFDYAPGGGDYVPGPGVKAVDGEIHGAGMAQVRLIFGYEKKIK